MTPQALKQSAAVQEVKGPVLAPKPVSPSDHVNDLFANFGLRRNPFGVTPDTRYFFGSRTHLEARSSLQVGIDSGMGFLALIAPPGMGKTTLLLDLLKHCDALAKTAFLFQFYCNSHDLLASVAAEFGLNVGERDVGELIRSINDVLVRAHQEGKRTILIVDEAQNLSNSVLETLRVLSNFETQSHKLLQIILCGQPQLGKKLSSRDLQQLSQRISIVTSLEPFTPSETKDYVARRLTLAGASNPSLFSRAALEAVHENSKGVPREINRLCFNALLLAKEMKAEQVEVSVVERTVQARKDALSCAASPYAAPGHSVAPAVKRSRSEEAETTNTREREARAAASILAGLAQETRTATGTEGVALLFGDEKKMVCWAKSGDLGLNVLSRAYADGGLIGYCMRSGVMQLCHDCERDIRVDFRASESQGIRSIAYLPLIRNKRLFGICGLFSSRADHFSRFEAKLLMHKADELLSRLSEHEDLLDVIGCNQQLQFPQVPAEPEHVSHHVSHSVPQQASNRSIGSIIRSGLRTEFPAELPRTAPVHEQYPLASLSRKPVATTPPADTSTRRTQAAKEEPVTLGMPLVRSSGTRSIVFALAAMVIFAMIGFAAIPEFRAETIAKIGHWSNHVRSGINIAIHSAPTAPPDSPHPPSPYGIDFLDRSEALAYLQGTASAGDLENIRVSAQKGDINAEYQFATRFADGVGVPQDFGVAAQWFQKAAENGMATAQWKLGLAFLHGVGIAADDERAAFWIKHAANQGKPLAQSALSQLYFAGRGTHRDPVKAYTWAVIATNGLQPGQAPDVQLLRQSLSAEQLANAEKRIASWSQLNSHTALNNGPQATESRATELSLR